MYNIKCNYEVKIQKENKFTANIKPKEKVIVETVNAYGDRFENLNELMELLHNKNGKTHHHPLTGPIYIEGAKKGDVLKVHIQKIKVKEMAQSLSRTAGIDPLERADLADRIPIIVERFSNTEIYYCNEIKLKYKPMIGIIATTPQEGIIKTGHASIHNGGNLDLPFITENVDVYLPVNIDGAGLYLGDVHSIQGYGELSGIAMEASSNIEIIVEILKPRKKFENIIAIGKEPFSEKQCIGIIGIGKNMDLVSSIHDAFIGGTKILKQLVPTLPENILKSILTLIGNSLNGQTLSKTSESTSIIIVEKEDIERVIKTKIINFTKEIENILFEKK